VADIPLLFESGKLSWLFAVTICVTVNDSSIQLERLQKRNPELSLEECQARINSQLPLAKKARMADIVIDNSGDFDDLSKQVEIVRRDLMGRLYGIGMSLLQMLLLIGGSTSIAVSSKFYSHWQQS
jgi:dephospho-CoA kinase